MTRARRALPAALAACVLVAGGCSGSSPRPKRGPTCSAAAVDAPLTGGSTGVIQIAGGDYSYPGQGDRRNELIRFDMATGRIAARCAGASALTSVDAGTGTGIAARLYGAAGTSARRLPGIGPGESNGVYDWRTGRAAELSFAGWVVLSVTPSGLLLQSEASRDRAQDTTSADNAHPTTAADYCVLPAADSPRGKCRPVPGSSGNGFPNVRPDGSVHWVPLTPVRAVFGTLHAWALTDGWEMVAFGPTRNDLANNEPIESYRLSVDGRAATVSFSQPDEPARWFTVTKVDAAGVHGTSHTATGVRGGIDFTEVAGFEASRDGRTLYLLERSSSPTTTADVSVTGLREGPAKPSVVTLVPPAGETYNLSRLYLVSWPDSGAPSTGS